jgi:hypothetical protein
MPGETRTVSPGSATAKANGIVAHGAVLQSPTSTPVVATKRVVACAYAVPITLTEIANVAMTTVIGFIDGSLLADCEGWKVLG